MSRYFCHDHPDTLALETRATDARPGAVVLERSPFHPGGGGQLTDRGVLRWSGGETGVTAIEAEGGRLWHLLAEPVEIAGTVQAVVDADFRAMMTQLHTDTHILNALVFQKFAGALVTGAQLNADATARMDFDLPELPEGFKDAVEAACNAEVGHDRRIDVRVLPRAEAFELPDIIRTATNLVPPEVAEVRIVDIVGLDQQADGGTHVASTSHIGKIAVAKIENKGRGFRRLRIRITD